MKKGLLIVIAVVVVAAAVVVGTRLRGPSGPKVKDPFTFDYKLDAGSIKSFTCNDDMSTLLASSPFYAGAQPLPGQHTQEFDEARAAKCEEIIAGADTLVEDTLKLKPKLEELRKALADYLTVCANQEPKSAAFVKDAGAEMLRLQTLELIVEADYKSIDTKSDNAFARSFMQYMKAVNAVQLASLYLQDIDNTVAFAAMGLDGLSSTKNSKLAEANKKLDDAMGGFNGMAGSIRNVMSGVRGIDYGFRQLATGDYYFARAAVAFMRDSMPKLKAAAASIKPNQYMDAGAVALTKDYLAKFDNFSAEFQKYLDSVPQSRLVPVAIAPNAPDWAYADEKPNDYGRAYTSVAQPTKDPAPEKEGWLATGWNGVKTVVHGTQSVIGVGVDIAGTAVKNITRVGAGVYYGNSAKEIWDDMKTNSNQIIKNWKANKSGAETMRTANQYINNIDDGADWLAGKAVEQTPFGEGWTSWLTGKVARGTAGIFTGLGKGITLIGNRQATASDYVIGGVEIGSSLIGGSKLVIKGSNLPGFLKGLAKGTWVTTEGAGNTLSKLIAYKEKVDIEQGIATAAKYGMQTFGFEGRKAMAEALIASINQTNAALKAEMKNIIKAGMEAGWENFNGTLRESLYNFARRNLEGNLKSFGEALVAGLGKNATEFADNVIAQWGEDVLKDMIDQAMAEAPLPEELKGVWTGTTTFTSINMPEGATEKAGKEGCDIGAMIKALKNKPLATKMRMDGAPSGSGSMFLQLSYQGKQGEPINATYHYTNGVLSISQGIENGSISLKGNARRMTQGYDISGTAVGKIGATENKIVLTGNFKVTKPH
jgi:hypothetical protein